MLQLMLGYFTILCYLRANWDIIREQVEPTPSVIKMSLTRHIMHFLNTARFATQNFLHSITILENVQSPVQYGSKH
jgi:hypothetical protein